MNSSMENPELFHACEYKQNLELLRQVYLFAKLPMEALKVLAFLCSKETYRAGDFLLRQGEADGQALLLLSGTARLVRENGGNERSLRNYGAHDFIGAMSLFGKRNRLYSLIAATDTTCLVLEREKFFKALAQFPAVVPLIVQAITERIHAWEEKLLARQEDHREHQDIVGISLI